MGVIDFASSSARTASGAGGVIDGLELVDAIRAQLNVTAASGISPSLTVVLEDTIDGTNWNTVATFTAKTGVSREVVNIASPFTGTIRASWTLSGTAPSFTFSIIAHAE